MHEGANRENEQDVGDLLLAGGALHVGDVNESFSHRKDGMAACSICVEYPCERCIAVHAFSAHSARWKQRGYSRGRGRNAAARPTWYVK